MYVNFTINIYGDCVSIRCGDCYTRRRRCRYNDRIRRFDRRYRTYSVIDKIHSKKEEVEGLKTTFCFLFVHFRSRKIHTPL